MRNGFVHLETTRGVRVYRVYAASALAELGLVDKTGHCGQNEPDAKGKVEDKVQKGRHL